MRYTIEMFAGLLVIGLPAAAKDQTTEKAQLVGTAKIVKIDASKMTLDVKDPVDTVPNRGIRLPGVGRIPIWKKPSMQYKVFVGKDTVLKLAEAKMEFSDLQVGDHILVSGRPKGRNIEAVSITRDRH